MPNSNLKDKAILHPNLKDTEAKFKNGTQLKLLC